MAFKRLVAAAAALLSITAPARAADIQLNQWYDFAAIGQGPGNPFRNGALSVEGTNPASIDAPEGPWTFTLGARGGRLVVLDGFDSSSQFTITNFGAVIGTTSAPIETGAPCGGNITACLASAAHSKGFFRLAAGDHSIWSYASGGSSMAAGAFFQVETAAVPEPASWAMMIGGLGIAGAGVRRRARARIALA